VDCSADMTGEAAAARRAATAGAAAGEKADTAESSAATSSMKRGMAKVGEIPRGGRSQFIWL
jgi:hypothetical protein